LSWTGMNWWEASTEASCWETWNLLIIVLIVQILILKYPFNTESRLWEEWLLKSKSWHESYIQFETKLGIKRSSFIVIYCVQLPGWKAPKPKGAPNPGCW
jgi:hypothetical protein